MANDKLPIVDLVIADRGWIMEEMAQQIKRWAPALNCRILDAPSHNADLTYFLPYSIQANVGRGASVSFFTHQEKVQPAHSRFIENAKKADHCICMSKRYERILREAGVDRVTTIYPGVDRSIFFPKLRVGVVGRTYHTGRKGEELVAQLVHEPWLEFLFLGKGWPGRGNSLQQEQIGDFYRSLDCLLVPSNIEGGPMPVMEAIACGCTVVAPEVGFVEMFPHLSYQTDNFESLSNVLKELYLEKSKLSTTVDELTWERYAGEHQQLFLALISKQPKEEARDTVVLLQHGSESRAKGGPTTRMNLLAEEMSQRELVAKTQSLADLERVSTTESGSVYHVYNSWPLHTAIDALEEARRLGALLAYSPIALDLRYLPIYQERLVELFKDGQFDEDDLDAIFQQTPEVDPADPRVNVCEGVKGHFQALRSGCAIADIVIALSDFEARYLTRLGVNPNKIKLVRNGIDAWAMSRAGSELFVQKYGLRDFILCVGRIEARKNQAGLAYALRECDVPIVFIGHQGDREYFNATRKIAGSSALFIDRIDDRGLLASAYHAAALTVLVSWCEGAPLVALEAGAAGCPLLLSCMSGEKEYFREYANYVHPLDVEGIRNHVNEALRNKETAGQRKQRSEFVCSEYSIERHCDATLAAYKAPVGEGTCTGGVYVDVTHLAHATASASDTTGMPKLEKELYREFAKCEGVNFLVWNSYFSTHVLVPPEKLESFQQYATGKYPAENGVVAFDSWQRNVDDKSLAKPMSRKRLALSLFKTGLSKLPAGLANLATRGVRVFRPLFNPDIEREHEITWERVVAAVAGERLDRHEANPKSGDQYKLKSEAIPARLEPGSKVLLCGQPWVSNDRYITSLEMLLDGESASLTVLIPDVIYVTHVDSFPRQTRSAFVQRLHRILPQADKVMVPSNMTESALSDIRSTYGYDYKIEKVRLGVPRVADRYSPVSGLVANNFVLYVASLNNRKNHEFLIEVWDRIYTEDAFRKKKLKLVLAGTNQLEGELAKTVQEAVDTEKVVLTGSATEEQLAWLYRNSLFTVYPSKVEGWGFPVQESLLAGKVCIASNKVPAATDYVTPGIVSLDPSDMFGWIDLIGTMALNDTLRHSMESQINVDSTDLWGAMAQQLLDKDA